MPKHCLRLQSAGTWYRLHDGQRLPLSLPGSLDPILSLPYSPSASFPQAPGKTSAEAQDFCYAGASSCVRQSGADIDVSGLPFLGRCQLSSPPDYTSKGFEDGCTASTASQHIEQHCSVSVDSCNMGSNGCSNTQPAGIECPVDCPLNAHFMAMAAKLMYEDPCVIADCLEHRYASFCSQPPLNVFHVLMYTCQGAGCGLAVPRCVKIVHRILEERT